MDILKLIGLYIGAFIALGYYIALLIIMLITVVYGVGYVYDSIFGNSLYKLGINIAKKYPNIRKWKILASIKRNIEPRTQFVRYETPLCTYCFSYTALSIIYMIMNNAGIKYGWVIAFVTYILIYFLGMYRRYEKNESYICVLDNNLEFLKLSFVPLTFLITMIGFAFTVAGFNLQQIDWEYFNPIISAIQEDGLVTGFANELWLVIKCSVAILLLLYIVSIPMQLVSYFIILVIKYFQKYGYGYKKVFSFFLKIWRNLS